MDHFKIQKKLVALPAEPFFSSIRCHDAREGHELSLPVRNVKQDYLRNSFFYRAPAIWNSLPPDVMESVSLESFKTGLVGMTLSPKPL